MAPFTCALAVAAAAWTCATALTLEKFVVVVSPNEGHAVQLALRDLDADLYTVTGLAASTLSAQPAPGSLPSNTLVVYFGTTAAADWLTAFTLPSGCTVDWEAHCVVALNASAPGTNGYASVVATGAGVRGAIYGAYTFSQAILGFQPMFLYTDTPAPFVGGAGVSIDPALAISFGSPRYKYRAVFPNDEDLTANHRADPLGRNVYDLATWDVVYATTLRMKANAMLIGTNPFPDNTATALAARRGLVISHHHYDLLGSNVFSWPLPSTDWDWSINAGSMSYMWRASIAAQAVYPEVVWSVGMRGLNDMPYPGCDTHQAACGAAISEVLANQTSWVRAYPNQANATLILYMWQELLELLTAGYLIIPPGVSVVFTDAGSGYVRTDANWTQYAAGCYYHTAMLDGTANQLTEMVPASRIAEQLLNVITKSLSTDVFVLNPSDIKPVPMTTAAVFDLVWDPSPWNATADFNATARAWYAKFGRDYALLPQDASVTYASLWEQYFNVGYIFAGDSDNMLASYIAGGATSIAAEWSGGSGVSAATVSRLAGYVSSTSAVAAQAQLAAMNASAWALLPSVPSSRRGFFITHMLQQFGLQLASVTTLLSLLSAAQALSGASPNPSSGVASLQASLSQLDGLLTLRRVTEGDASAWTGVGVAGAGPAVNMPQAYPLRGFYLADTLTDMQAARASVNTALLAVQAPVKTPLLPVRSSSWYRFENYQAQWAANWPLVGFNPAWNLPTYVRCNCRVSDVTAGTCAVGPDGGAFTRGSDATLTLQIMTSDTEAAAGQSAVLDTSRAAMAQLRGLGLAGLPLPPAAPLVIYYTADGTTPSPTSPSYTPGAAPKLTDLLAAGASSVTVKAMAWIDGVATGQVTTTTWVAR